jgi:ATP phosphoribosyltransferase
MKRLRLAIQKSGRLSEESSRLIADCGIHVPPGKTRLRGEAFNFPIEVIFVRNDDIPGYVADGVADAGIVGENTILEKAPQLRIVQKLGFGQCRLAIAVPAGRPYASSSDLDGLDIATSHPVILQRFLDERGVTASIHYVSGSVEVTPGIGLADAICDLVSSGGTLVSNGLKEVEEVMQTEAVLVAGTSLDEDRNGILEDLSFRMNAVRRARDYKYILLNVPNSSIDRVIELLPGMKSPTVMPLAEEGWSSLHSVVREDDFWNVIEHLKGAGAQGVLVAPVEKMVL